MSNIGEASTYFFRVPDVDPKKAFFDEMSAPKAQ